LDHGKWKKQSGKPPIIDRILQKLLHFSIRNALTVVIVAAIILIAGVPFVFKVTAETNMLKFFEPRHPLTMGTDLIEQKLTGVMPLEIEIYGDGRDSIKKVAMLRQIKSLKQWLIAQPEIDKVNSVVDIIEDMHQGFHQGKLEYLKIPDNDQLLRQYFFIYDGNDIYEFVNREFDHTRIILSLNNHNSKDIRGLINRIKQYISQNITSFRWDIGGEGRLFADQDKLLIQGQLMSLVTATLLIFLIMLFLWKKLLYAAITMIPNLSPIIGIFILMGVFNIWLDMATAMIASVSIGIAVDDTIHLFHGYKKRIDKGVSVIFALMQSYYKVGRAIIVTTFILCAQFLLLSFSQFVPTAHFGLLTATGLLMALIFDLLLLPALIVVLHHKQQLPVL
jgi:predicted RND superfamily exporter protein